MIMCGCEVPNCELFRDVFDRAVGTDVNNNWEELVGEWTISDDFGFTRPQLWMDGNQTDSLIYQNATIFPDGKGNVEAILFALAPAMTGPIRVLGAFTDSDNYLAAQLAKSGSNWVLTLIKREGGSESILDGFGTSFSLSSFLNTRLIVCWNGTIATAYCPEVEAIASAATSMTGSSLGIRCSENAGFTVRIAEVKASKVFESDVNCPVCPETHVECGTAWSFDGDGQMEGSPWTQIALWEVRFDFENSSDSGCDGENNNIQTGRASKRFTLGATQNVKVTLTGEIEKMNPGYDGVSVLILPIAGGTPVLSVNDLSDDSGGVCVMDSREKSQTNSIAAGTYCVRIVVNSVDARYHKDAFWEVKVEFL